MKTIAHLVSFVSLAGTIVPPVMFFAGLIGLESAQRGMLIAAVAWFAAAPVWMDR